jgi:cell division protein DivIC
MHTRRSKKERRRLVLISMAILGAIFVLVSTVFADWQQIMRNRREENELSALYDNLLEEEIKLNQEINKLQDDAYLARYAKEKYMLSKEGETIIQMK